MVQGKVKTKLQVFGKGGRNKQKFVHQKKNSHPKGARYIGPKKAKQIEASKLKKNISKLISCRNEKDMIAQAVSKEPKALSIVSSTSGAGDSKKKGKK